MRAIHVAILLTALGNATVATAQARDRVARTELPAAVVSQEQFRALRWLAGRWYGIGVGSLSSVGAFYEEYAIVDDSTMRLHTHADSTFTRIIDFTRFELRGGRLSAIPARGSHRHVVRITGDSTYWNGFGTVYARVSDDLWRAIFPARPDDPRPRYYELRRLPSVTRTRGQP